jgi:hypothetical protein
VITLEDIHYARLEAWANFIFEYAGKDQIIKYKASSDVSHDASSSDVFNPSRNWHVAKLDESKN